MKSHIKMAKMKLPLHEFLFVKATAPGRHVNLDGKGEIDVIRVSPNEILAMITLKEVSDINIILEKVDGIYTYSNGTCCISFLYDAGFNLHVICMGQASEEFPYWDEMCEIFNSAVFALGG